MTTTADTSLKPSVQADLETPVSARDLVTIEPVNDVRRWSPPRSVRRVLGPVGVLVLWYVLNQVGVLDSKTLAGPQDVLSKAWDLTINGTLPSAIGVSGLRVVYGFAIGAFVGIGLALLAGLFRIGEDIIDSTVGMFRTLPWVGLIPLFIIWFGIDEKPKIALVAIGVTFPLYLNTYGAIRGVDSGLIEAGNVLGLSRLGMIRHVILPGALPGALVGLRYSLGIAWLALVFAEQVNAQNGIGYLMNNAEQFFQTDIIVVCLLVYAVLGMVTDLIVRIAIKHLLSWRTTFEGA